MPGSKTVAEPSLPKHRWELVVPSHSTGNTPCKSGAVCRLGPENICHVQLSSSVLFVQMPACLRQATCHNPPIVRGVDVDVDLGRGENAALQEELPHGRQGQGAGSSRRGRCCRVYPHKAVRGQHSIAILHASNEVSVSHGQHWPCSGWDVCSA